MTGNCGTCQHWGAGDDVQRICDRIIDMDMTPPDDLARTTAKGGFSFLLTRPDFGCVLHEQVAGVDPAERPLVPQRNVHPAVGPVDEESNERGT